MSTHFNPRSPRGGATVRPTEHDAERTDFNPRSPRGGATFSPRIMGDVSLFQSTLPTRGSDTKLIKICITKLHISIHAPHEGERLSIKISGADANIFQSTLPTRGSDQYKRDITTVSSDFNPRSPRGGATRNKFAAAPLRQISIHAPHEGERQRKSAFVCSISANLLNIIHCGTVTRAVSRRRIALFRLFSVRRSGVFMYAYASH